MPDIEIRAEAPGDAESISGIHRAAFGGALEAELVERLREEGELLVSLVATAHSGIVGHIAIAPTGTAGGLHFNLGWLAPVGVMPEHQGQGVGTGLVRAALDQARALGLAGVIVLGDPHWYSRFSFCAAKGLGSRFAGPALQFLQFGPDGVQGDLIEPRAFAVVG